MLLTGLVATYLSAASVVLTCGSKMPEPNLYIKKVSGNCASSVGVARIVQEYADTLLDNKDCGRPLIQVGHCAEHREASCYSAGHRIEAEANYEWDKTLTGDITLTFRDLADDKEQCTVTYSLKNGK